MPKARKDKPYKVTLKIVLHRSWQIDAPSKKAAIEKAKECARSYKRIIRSDDVQQAWADEMEVKSDDE